MLGLVIWIGIAIILGVISYALTAGFVWVACWAFGIAFSLKIALGVWVALILLKGTLKVTVKKD